jgi:serine/threonine-protein kinase
MGEVFLARHEGPAGFAKGAVVKRILPHLSREPAFVEMFVNEARLAAVLNHPNVVQIFELGETDGTYFIAMEYVHGRSLRNIRQRAEALQFTVPPMIHARMISLVLQGLHHAHQMTDSTGGSLHIVHRDVSPDNVLVGFNGSVKLLDFGIAKASVSISTTRVGSVKGKFAYMAPEQINGETVDGRADVYSAGVVLYELLAGQRPFKAGSEPALITAVLSGKPRPLRQLKPEVPEALEEIVLKALARSQEDRFPTAEAMSSALEVFIRDELGTKSQEGLQIPLLMRHLFGDQEASTNPGVASQLYSKPPRTESKPSAPTVPGPADVGARFTDLEGLPRRRWPGLFVLVLVIAGAAMGLRLFNRAPPKTVMARKKEAAPVLAPKVLAAPPVLAAAPRPAATPRDEAEHEHEHEHEEDEHEQASPPSDPGPPHVEAKPPAKASATSHAHKVHAPPHPAASGKLDVRVNPWAEIFLDGKSLGVTPLDAPLHLPAGKLLLTLKNSDLGVERKVPVTIKANEAVTVKVNMMEGP